MIRRSMSIEKTAAAMVLDSSSKIGKRMRDADDEVYLDNFHCNKRYLTEVISSSLNGLKVGDVDISRASTSADFAESPSRSETAAVISKSVSSLRNYAGDDVSPLDSPMSDSSEESVGYRITRLGQGSLDPALAFPASPDRNQMISSSPSPSRSLSRSFSCPLSPSSSSLLRQRSHDSEGRLPPSPSDPCQQPDLRRAALMRALQIRARSPGGLQSRCMYDPRPQQILERDRPAFSHRQGSMAEQSDMLGSPLHGQAPAQGMRASSSVRSLLLDEKPAESVATAEEMDRSDDGPNEDTSVQKKSRSNRAKGECYSRLNRGKLRRHTRRSSTISGDISDTESSL